MNTPITSDNLFFVFGKKIENKKISDILQTHNLILNIEKNEEEKISEIIHYNFQLEKNLLNFEDDQKLIFTIKSCLLDYNNEGNLIVKNRIRLKNLDFDEILKFETLFETNFWKENKNLFIVWYKKQTTNWKNSKIIRSKFLKLEIDENTTNILAHDYQIIRNKIFIGKAHELAEGDTKYLAVIRDKKIIKKPDITQPYSVRKTYERSIVFKQSFLQILFDNDMSKDNENTTQIELLIKRSVSNYKNRPISFLMEEFQINKLYPKIKEDIFFKILNVGSAVEFNKEENTNFNFFTITLNSDDEINNKIKINFNLLQQLRNPQLWEDSETLKEIEKTSYVLIYKESEKDKLNPKVVDIKKINFSDETIDFLREEYRKLKKEIKNLPARTRIKEKFIYLDNEIIKKELRDL